MSEQIESWDGSITDLPDDSPTPADFADLGEDRTLSEDQYRKVRAEVAKSRDEVELRAAQILCVNDDPCERHLLDAYSLRMSGVLAQRILPLGEEV